MSEEEFRKKGYDMNYSDEELDRIIEHRKEAIKAGIIPPDLEDFLQVEIISEEGYLDDI